MSPTSEPRVALVHDWLTGMRGGEKCLEILIHLYPEADLYTLIHRRGTLSPTIEKMNIRTSFIQHLPLLDKFYRYYLPLFPRAIESFDFSPYELVISTSHCVAKGAITGPGICHICYCFTPMRYAWDQFDAYFGHLKGLKAAAVGRLMARIRDWDVASSDRVDHFLAISDYVRQRINKYYGREARVIYPPVNTDFFTPSTEEGDYYLVVSALAPYKRLDIIARAAEKLPFPVKIVGSGPEERNLKKMAGRNVEFLGWLTDEELKSVYRGCRALLFSGEEDFGLTPLEAMACGKAVIGYGKGGVTETVIPHREKGMATTEATGVFFDDQNPHSLVEAVSYFERNRSDFDVEKIRAQAEKFSIPSFIGRMTEAINDLSGKAKADR